MAKTKDQKKKLLDELMQAVSESKATIFVQYDGTPVASMQDIRKALKESNANMKVAKNTLLKKALEENKFEVSSELLSKPVAIAFDMTDEVNPAKLVYEKSKEVETIKILGGVVNGEVVDAAKIEALAKMPSREELYAKLIGTINAPRVGFVNVLAGNLRGLVQVLNQYKEKKEKEA